MFLAACAVLPDHFTEGKFDLDEFYFEERRYIVSLIGLGLLFDVGDFLVSAWEVISVDPTYFLTWFLPLNLLFGAALSGVAWSERKWVHWLAFAVIFGVAFVGFSGWAVSGLPALVSAPALP